MSLKGIFPIDRWNFNSQSILKDLPPDDYRQLIQHATEKTYIKGELIFKAGNHPSGIFYIQQGKVKKYTVDNLDKEQIIYVANTGDLVGYHALLAGESYPDSASALEESVITFIPAADFLTVLDQSPILSKRLLKTLSHEFGVLANSISVFGQRPVRERLAIALLVLREKFKNDTTEGDLVTINISRDDIASMVGATRENIVRLLRDFKDEQLIQTKGRKIWVTDITRLAKVSNYK